MVTAIAPKQWWALIGICLLAFILFLDVGIVANALPAIQKALDANTTELQWLIAAFMLALCACMVTMGRLGDIFGLRKVFYINIVLFSVASLGAGMSHNIFVLIFFRALQGITAAAVPLSPALITHNFAAEHRPKAMAIFSIITGSGLALGPVIGGFLIDTVGWRWIFLINVPIAIIGLLICAKTVIEAARPPQRESFDLWGALLLLIGMSSLVISLIQGNSWGWTAPLTLTGLCLAIITLPAFVIVELHKQHPLINFHLLNNRTFIPAAVTCVVFGTFMATLLFLNPLYLQDILPLNASQAGLLLFIISAMVVIIGPAVGWLTHHYGTKIGTTLVLLLTLISAFSHYFFTDHLQILTILIAFMTFGIAWGILNIAPVLAVTATVAHQNTGMVMGALWSFLNVGASAGLAVMGILFHWQEKQFFLQHLQLSQIPLNARLLTLVQSLLNEPEHIQQVLNEFSENFAETILPLFKQAFMHGFHTTVFWLGIIAAIALIFVAVTMREPQSSIPPAPAHK